jgi:hypothetical protein
MAEWTDYPAEVVAFELGSSLAAVGPMSYPVEIIAAALSQEDIYNSAYPMPYVIPALDLGVDIGAVLVAPPVLTLGLDFNSSPLLYGIMKDATWVVSLHCQQKPLQYWG